MKFFASTSKKEQRSRRNEPKVKCCVMKYHAKWQHTKKLSQLNEIEYSKHDWSRRERKKFQ